MKILHISHSDNNGGAARAAYRIHRALLDIGIESKMFVQDSNLGDWTITSFENKWGRFFSSLRLFIASLLTKLNKTGNPILHSPSIFSSDLLKIINNSKVDLVHLHWIQGEMLTINDISKIKKPIVWTLHDMWAFCGAEHVSWDLRWKYGYNRHNRPDHESGIDLNRIIWKYKKRSWKNSIQIITPSNWLAGCVNQSYIMKNWPVSVIHNPLNTSEWKPLEMDFARDLLCLPKDSQIILFGTMASNMDYNKGFDLLLKSLDHLYNSQNIHKGLNLVIFGQFEPEFKPELPFPSIYIGHLHDNLSLRALYSSADVVLVPSRIEAFGQTASEAHSCGTPVVSFATSGLLDIIDHMETGYLAKCFDPIDFANGITWVLNNTNSLILREKSRQKAVNYFSSNLIANQYLNIYNNFI
jgi:glycosyltransferase involved in cell wall biosynthesis